MNVRFLPTAVPLVALLLASGAVPRAAFAQDALARVNGVAITRDEYLRALEQVPVTVATGNGTSARVQAGQVVLDQLIGRKIVEGEAAKRGVAPTQAEVERRYVTQTRLLQQQMPGVSVEDALRRQGASAESIKTELRYQMSETNLLAREMNLSEDAIKKAYETNKTQIGIPARVQLRIVAPQNAAQVGQAQKMLGAKTDFVQVAKQINPPSLQATAGMMARPIPVSDLPPAWRAKAQQASEGASFGPVEWPAGQNRPASRVWIRVERKFAPVPLSFEDAKPLVKQQLVQARLADPQNQKLRRDIAAKKLNARFEASDPRYQALWESLRRASQSAAPAATARSGGGR